MALYSNQDQQYLKRCERERISLTGQDCLFYSLVRGGIVGSKIDPLYDEPVEYNHFPHLLPFTIVAAVTYSQPDNRNPEAREEGLLIDYDAEFFVSRLEWELKAPLGLLPKEGDLIFAMAEWFDLTKASRAGNIIDTTDIVGFKFELKKSDKFDPKRSI